MIGELLKIWRMINKLSLREASLRIGLSPATLNRIESGKSMDQNSMVIMYNWMFGGFRS